MTIDSKTAVVQGILGYFYVALEAQSYLLFLRGVIGEHCWHLMSFDLVGGAKTLI